MRERLLPAIGLLLLVATALVGQAISLMPPQEQPNSSQSDNAGAQPSKDSVENTSSALDEFVAWLGGLSDGDITAYATVVISVFTVILGIGTVFLVIDGRRHSRHELQAYISGFPNWLSTIYPDQPVSAKFAIINHGITPATEMTHSGVILVLPYPLPDNFPRPEFIERRSSKSVVFADRPLNGGISTEEPFSPAEIQALQSNTARIYIFGEIKYRDVFRRSHTTRFCSNAVPSPALAGLISGNPANIEVDFEVANQHNEMD